MQRAALILSVLLAGATGALAQESPPPTAAERAHAVDTLIRRMDHYVLSEHKPAVVAKLRADRARYVAIQDPEAFRTAINKDLYAVSRDKHLQVWINRSTAPQGAPPSEADQKLQERRQGHGIDAVRRLPANIGYLRLLYFSGDPDSGEAIDRAMAVLGDSDALILDLRKNGGGGEAALNRLMSHMAPRPLELAALHMRVCEPPPANAPDGCVQKPAREVRRRWADTVAQPQFAGKPIYVLTSRDTFSAAEEAAYDLQQEKLAVIVGETTGGGANPSATMDLGERFVVIMPLAESRHPQSGRNWDGVGVKPDVAVPADQALAEAYRRALAAPVGNDPGLAEARTRAAADVQGALSGDAGL